jgi:peptidoglycan/LPS O-acetylase OafA/YrhL
LDVLCWNVVRPNNQTSSRRQLIWRFRPGGQTIAHRVSMDSSLMFILDRSKNDTSIALDLVRAFAAQIVCMGHALNFAKGATITFAPNVGVLIFFILSGFVIAHTLVTKAASPEYGLAAFGIERFSRIYTAYLPALLLIAACDYAMQYLGHPLPGDPTDLRTLLGNLTMRQGLPGAWGVSTFGSAGQLTSVAVEFHIYFFVGAIFFLLKARSVLFCLIVAMFFSTMPLGYFSNFPDTDRALFVLWLAGFASYFVARSASVDGNQAILGAAAFVGLVWYWAAHRTPNDYDLSNYPALSLAFLALVISTSAVHVLGKRLSRLIRFAADYSFSLFLIHLTIVKLVLAIPASKPVAIISAVLLANAAAILFSFALERRYRQIAEGLKVILLRPSKLVKIPSS